MNTVVRERAARPQEAQEARDLSQGDLSQPIAAPLQAPKQTVLILGRFSHLLGHNQTTFVLAAMHRLSYAAAPETMCCVLV